MTNYQEKRSRAQCAQSIQHYTKQYMFKETCKEINISDTIKIYREAIELLTVADYVSKGEFNEAMNVYTKLPLNVKQALSSHSVDYIIANIGKTVSF